MKKGFTLAELLAVLVILGIISAITIPIVTTQLSNYKTSLCKTQYQNILNAARAYGADNIMTLKDGDTVTLGVLKQKGYIGENIKNPVTKEEINDDLIININNVGTNKTKFKYTFNSSIESYCKTTPTSGNTVKTYTVGEEVNYNPTLGEKCSNPVSTTGTKTGCMKFYVIKDNGSSVDVLLDHNTTAKVAWNSNGNNASIGEVATQLSTDTQGWSGSPRLITKNEIATITGKTVGELGSTYSWLWDNTGNENGTYGYWTSSPVDGNSDGAYYVDSYGNLSGYVIVDNNYTFGVRPVITIQKSVLN